MKNYNWESFTKKIAIKTEMAELYAAWTTPGAIEKWFLSKADFTKTDGTKVTSNSHINTGDTYAWSWYLYDQVETGKVMLANGKDQLQFTFAGDCLVDVQLTQQDDHVIVSLTQSNIPTDDQSKRGIRLGCDSGWSFFLLNLKSVYEGGIDLRNKNEVFQGMLNN